MVLGLTGGNVVEIVIRAKDEFSKTMKGVSQTLKNNRAAFMGVAAAGTAIVGGLGLAIKAAADFDASMTKSLAIMGDVSETMRKDMSDAAREVAKTTTFSANQAAESYFFLASAGLDAEESIAALPVVAQFAQAGMFDMAKATDILTDAQSALGLTLEDPVENMKEMNRLSDILVKANTIANATVEQFGTSLINKAAPAMRNVNMEVEEGVAILAVWADQGIKGERAGTAFRMTIDNLINSARENAREFKAYGIEVMNAEGELRNMADIVKDMENSLGSLTVEQRNAALSQLGFNIKSREGILALMGNSEQLRTYENELRNAGGTAEEVASKQLETLNSQLKLLKSDVTDIAIDIGNTLIPILLDFVEKIKPVVENITDWIDANPKLTRQITIVTGVIGGLLGIIGAIGLVLPPIIKGFKLIKLVIGLLSWKILVVIAVIAALISIGVLLWKNWNKITSFIKTHFAPQIEGIKLLIELLKLAFTALWEYGIKPYWNKMMDFRAWLMNRLSPILEGIISTISFIGGAIGGVISGVSSFTRNLFSGATSSVRTTRQSITKMADGGIVTRPTTALIGEAGPEAVIPLKKNSSMGMTITIEGNNIYGTDPDDIAEALMDKLSNKITV